MSILNRGQSPETEKSSPALLIFDHVTRRLVSANPRACQMLETSQVQLLNSPQAVLSILQIEPSELVSGAILRKTLRRKDGSKTVVEITVESLELPKERILFAVLQDGKEVGFAENSSRLVRVALDSADDMIALIDPGSLRFVQVNQGAVRALGYSEEELLAFQPTDLKPKISFGEYQRRYVEPLLRGECSSLQFETVHRRKDGTEYPVEVLLQRVDEGADQIVLLNITRDITGRHRSNLERDRFFSVSPEMLCIADTSGYFIRVNPAFSTVLGYSIEEFLTRPYLDFVHADDVANTTQALRQLSSGKRLVGFENRYRRIDGTFRTIQWTSMFDSTTGRIYAGARDVTEEREREHELAEKNRRLEEARKLERAARKSLLTFNRRKGVDDALAEVLKVLAEELQLRPLAIYVLDEWSGTLNLSAGLSLASQQPQTLQLGIGLVGEAAFLQTPILLDVEDDQPEGIPMRLQTGVGELYPRAIFAIPLVHQERTLAVLTGASQRAINSTEWSALQQLASQTAVGLHSLGQFEQLRTLSEQLNERGRRIAHQNRELKRANRLKSEFLANMSHELRTPLNAIIGFSECLKDGLLGELEAEQADYAGEIFNSGQHLLSLINDILDLSKIEAGMMELRLEETDVKHVIINSISIVRELAAKKSLQLIHEFDPQLKSVWLDARKFRQIIYNLLSNAVKFTEQRGKISVKASLENGELVVSVEDTGIGIAAVDQQRLFQPFVQLDGDLDRKYQGTGLGLGLVKGFVNLHHGSLELWSELGVGSRFTVRIPSLAKDAEQTQKKGRPSKPGDVPEGARLGSPQILVVDDDDVMREFLKDCLTPAGYEVLAASDSEQALVALRDHIPALILLDILLETKSSRDFLGTLKRNPLYRAIPIVILSNGLAHPSQNRANKGAVDLLQKPVTAAQLLRAISQAGVSVGTSESPRVLVVDDDPQAVDYVARVLEAKDCHVYRAYGGRDALDILEQADVDIVILDLIMPGIAGFEVLWNLRSASKNSDVPVVVLTAKTLSDEERNALKGSVSAILQKSQSDEQDVIQAVGLALRGGFNHRIDDTSTAVVKTKSSSILTSPKILLIAVDQRAVAKTLPYFEGTPLQVTVAYTGPEALEQAEFEAPDLILVEMIGLQFDGGAVLDLLEASPQTADIPKVAFISPDRCPLEESKTQEKVQYLCYLGETDKREFLSKIRSLLEKR